MSSTSNQDQYKKDREYILDTMGGADGGISFVKYHFKMQNLAKMADEGDTAAAELIELHHRFAKLISALQ